MTLLAKCAKILTDHSGLRETGSPMQQSGRSLLPELLPPEVRKKDEFHDKIDIISGFLGAGKTTFIKKLLEEAIAGEQVVLIENEFGEIGIDGGFLKDAGIEIREMIPAASAAPWWETSAHP